jgi:hypothetical protein
MRLLTWGQNNLAKCAAVNSADNFTWQRCKRTFQSGTYRSDRGWFMPIFKVTVDFSGNTFYLVEARTRDDAAEMAEDMFTDCDKGSLTLGEIGVVGSFAESITDAEAREL